MLAGLLLAAALLCTSAAWAQEPATSAADRQELLNQADTIFKEMSEMTGLPIKAPLKKKFMSRPEIRALLEETLDSEYTPQELHRAEAEVKAFGLVSRDFDLREFLLTFYTEQAAGMYDPRSQTMVLADWTPLEIQKVVLAHELTHALQDQNFDLDNFMHSRRDDADASAARQAMIEGYATAAMIQKSMGNVPVGKLPNLQPLMEGSIRQQFAEFPAFTSAPYFFRLQALFPYVHGLGFTQRALQNYGSWEKLNALFENPPEQTREIFDPAIFFEQKPLEPLSLPHPPALDERGNLKLLSENTQGELGYLGLIGQFLSEEEAKAIAPAWRADRFIVYEGDPDGRLALVARTRWSGPEPTLAFFRAYRTILGKKFPDLATDPRSQEDLFVGKTSAGMIILLRKGDECRWAEGVPTSKTGNMLTWLESF